jgi:hypothetical protein
LQILMAELKMIKIKITPITIHVAIVSLLA